MSPRLAWRSEWPNDPHLFGFILDARLEAATNVFGQGVYDGDIRIRCFAPSPEDARGWAQIKGVQALNDSVLVPYVIFGPSVDLRRRDVTPEVMSIKAHSAPAQPWLTLALDTE